MKKIKKILTEKDSKMTKIDYVILGIIIITYSILSFINLGSFTNPETFYEIKKKETITFEFKDLTDVVKIKFYNGEKNSNYILSVSSNNKTYTKLKTLEGTGAFSWNEEKILQRIKYIKITPKEENGVIGEIAFYDNSKNRINPVSILSTKTNQQITTLTDEQKKVPNEISYLNSTYFDEIYFARTAYDYANHLEAYEWVHPPLGKLIQAIPVKLFGMAPFFYRLMGNIAGILMIVVMYLFAKKLFKTRKYAIFAALLMYFDCFHFAHTRMGTVDSFLVLFIMLSFYYMYRYIETKDNKKNLFLSGLFFGLSISVKWTGFMAGLGLAIIYFIDWWKQKKSLKNTLLYGICFFVFIPFLIYTSTYLIYPNIQVTTTNSIPKIIKQTEKMYQYHSTLEATHPFQSSWYTWPISYKPVWYYTNEVDEYNHGTIVGIGNIAIWWMGIIAVFYLVNQIIRKKDKKSLFLIIVILSLWLPYLWIGRAMFLYHYFPVLPFLMLSITKMFEEIEKNNKWKFLLPIYLIIVIIVFILYYPAISGKITSNNYLDSLKLLSSWYF